MEIRDASFWAELAAAASRDDALRAKCEHARGCAFSVMVGEARHLLEFHRGRLAVIRPPDLRGASFSIVGPADEWEGVLTGATPYARAINVLHGRLRVEGDALALTWMTPALWQLWRISSTLLGRTTHG
ncbi:hypothetical protein [uncultured Enterovirga sp.]|uniref:hypothetical protein n=1 Tax=uncultured Enterovirga sp. TaxID=2026352 RepID=UPI0035CAE74A